MFPYRHFVSLLFTQSLRIFATEPSGNPTMQAPLIVAHRGASADAPENTLPAFHLAWKQGADAIEGDFRLTRDGVIVCFHDEDTERVTGIQKTVSESTFEELSRLRVGPGKDIRIPRLDDVLDTLPPNGILYIEIKSDTQTLRPKPDALADAIRIVPKIKETLDSKNIGDAQIRIISFDPNVIRAAKQQMPEMKAFLLIKLKEDRRGRITPTPTQIRKRLTEIGADGLSTGKSHLDRSYIQAISRAGFEIHVWTVDDEREARQLANAGIYSITTNRPGELRKHL
jgi:glycerophosphoryl diester phosphodiesterase